MLPTVRARGFVDFFLQRPVLFVIDSECFMLFLEISFAFGIAVLSCS